MNEVIITIVSTESSDGVTFPITRVFRLEFDTLEDALNYIDTSNEPKGLLNVQEMGA